MADRSSDPGSRPTGFAGLRDLRPERQSDKTIASASPAPPSAQTARPATSQSAAGASSVNRPAIASGGGSKRTLLILLGIGGAIGAFALFDDGKQTGTAVPQYREVLPPIAQNATLGRDQIRYCVAEDIRLEAARRVLNGARSWEIQRFNDMVQDYNARCSSFRYRSGALQSVRSEVEARRYLLERDGAARFGR